MANTLKLPIVIEPSKSYVEDFEIISFDNEQELDYYSLWHDKLRGKSFDDIIQQRPSRQKTQQQQQQQQSTPKVQQQQQQQQRTQEQPKRREPSRNAAGQWQRTPKSPVHARSQQQQQQQQPTSTAQRTQPQLILHQLHNHNHNHHHHHHHHHVDSSQLESINQQDGKTVQHLQTTLPPDGKVLMKYKLTKLYNKLRGRQMRRNLVHERSMVKRLEGEIAKSHLNSWTAYTALQALRIPDQNMYQLSTIAINNNPKFITIPRVTTPAPATPGIKNSSSSSKKKKSSTQTPTPSPVPTTMPMHYVYLDPNDIVTYSNQIYPQQIVSYKRRAHLLPSSATSKKSSAASYDAYEIMEVLANSDNTNVTITRNANKPAPTGCSIYSHSINNNTKTPGIVSTQLHLQARSYLDTVAKFYSEEAIRLAEEEERLKNEPSIEEQISKYIKIKNTS